MADISEVSPKFTISTNEMADDIVAQLDAQTVQEGSGPRIAEPSDKSNHIAVESLVKIDDKPELFQSIDSE